MPGPTTPPVLAVLTALTLNAIPAAMAGDESLRARDLAATCAACHGTRGVSRSTIPGLAGRNADELLHLLRAFRDDRRPATVMNYHARGYSDDELKLMSDYFSRQKPGGQP